MTRVLLASAYDATQPGTAASALLQQSRGGSATFTVVADPQDADLILFVEYHPGNDPYFFKVLGHPLRQRFPAKCVLYTDADRWVPLMPTVGPSVESWQYSARLCRPFPYVTREYHNDAFDRPLAPTAGAPRYLFSFVGASRTHPLRARLLKLSAPDALLIDTGEQRGWLLHDAEKVAYERRYREACLDSQFVLCPRGSGPSSYRLYEAMQLGRAPVVVSDAWVPHDGPSWSECVVRVREANVPDIPAILRERAGEAARMGERARCEWQRWVAPEVALERLVGVAAELVSTPRGKFHQALALAQFAHPFHLRTLLRYFVRLRHLDA